MEAIIVKWEAGKPFGFAQTRSGRNIFLHIKNWREDDPPAVGQRVQFELGPSYAPGKPDQGINIRFVQIDAATQAAIGAVALGVAQESKGTTGVE